MIRQPQLRHLRSGRAIARTLCALVLLTAPIAAGCDDGGGDDKGSKKKAKDEAPKVIASCDRREQAGEKFKVCNEYTGGNWTASEVQARCGGDGQVFIEGGPCPTDGLVTSCKLMAGKPMESTTRYYDKKDEAIAACGTIGGESI